MDKWQVRDREQKEETTEGTRAAEMVGGAMVALRE